MGIRRKREAETGVTMEDVYTAANWVSTTTGYDVQVGMEFRTTEGGVTPPPRLFARLLLKDQQGQPSQEAHMLRITWPTVQFRTMEGLALWLLYEVERWGMHISAERER